MKEYEEKIIELNGNRKLQNALKKAGIELFNPIGRWNGYGYERLPLVARIKTLSDMRKFNKIKKEIESIPKKKEQTEEEKIEKWAKRLSKLSGVTIEQAVKIAKEKNDYKIEQINELEDRQSDRYSVQRQKIIKKIWRSNPLRYIRDEEHAEAIISASYRHNCTNYEELLDEAREKAKWGEIDYEDIREYARANAK